MADLPFPLLPFVLRPLLPLTAFITAPPVVEPLPPPPAPPPLPPPPPIPSPSTSRSSSPSSSELPNPRKRTKRRTPDTMDDLMFQDPRWRDGLGPVPRWTPDMHKPWKPGESKLAWIWPRDKRLKNTPLTSATRWADVLTGKGPGMFIGDRTRFGPTRATWSNWVTPNQAFDSLGYRDEHRSHIRMPGEANGGRYDFRRRRYTTDWFRPEVWSDVKWGRSGDTPLFVRDGWGQERTARQGLVLPWDNTRWGNDFRYRPHTDAFDWARPEPRMFWDPQLHA